jgi:EAL domain-containing protein (putative c-di-GMP-specific phosphodiesterase class I)
MAINVSVRQFQSADLVTQFEQALSRYRLRAESVEIEITETLLLDATPTVEKAVNDLHDMGFTLSMDDFGTGYSSLTGLRRFPISTLKIDRSFVRGLPDNHDDVTLIDAIVNMARGMELNLIGEGVETEQQRAFLAGRCCDYLQGYLFSKPVPAEHLRVPVVSN